MAREYIKVFHDFPEATEHLTDAECGRLVRALVIYSRGGEVPELRGNERFAFSCMRLEIDRDRQNYEGTAKARSEAGKLGAAARWQGHKDDGKNANAISATWQNGKHGQDKDKDKDKDKDQDKENKSARTPRGQYGWVRLSDDEYSRLLADLGETELARCIAYVDESAQSSGNKNHWRDWNLVIRRCHRDGWGLSQGKTRATQPGTNVEASRERIKKNADWLDQFLAEQGGGG